MTKQTHRRGHRQIPAQGNSSVCFGHAWRANNPAWPCWKVSKREYAVALSSQAQPSGWSSDPGAYDALTVSWHGKSDPKLLCGLSPNTPGTHSKMQAKESAQVLLAA